LVNLTQRQIDYYNDKHRFIVLPAGRRSRKTLIGRRKVFNTALENAQHRYFYGAPTHKQAKDIFWNTLKRDSTYFRIDKSDSDLMVKLINGTEIHVVGLDKPERIEGQIWHGCLITEVGNLKPDAWGAHIRPALSDTDGFALLDGVPEGMNHYYDLALYAAGNAIPTTLPVDGAYAENPEDQEWAYYHWFSSDVLKPAEIEAAKRQLDEKTYRQEYEGSFESFAGLAYYAFGKHNLDLVTEDHNKQVHIGMDFNVDPMTATLGHIVGDEYRQFGEVWLENSNTYEMRDHLIDRFRDPRRLTVYPDATGKARESNATKTDLAILRDAGIRVLAKTVNPRQKDRVNAVNSVLQHVRWKINPQECPKTINDLNRRQRTADGRLNKEQEKEKIGHISDGGGYLISYNWPVRKREVYIAA
jgi:hypothetical protein